MFFIFVVFYVFVIFEAWEKNAFHSIWSWNMLFFMRVQNVLLTKTHIDVKWEVLNKTVFRKSFLKIKSRVCVSRVGNQKSRLVHKNVGFWQHDSVSHPQPQWTANLVPLTLNVARIMSSNIWVDRWPDTEILHQSSETLNLKDFSNCNRNWKMLVNPLLFGDERTEKSSEEVKGS